VHERKLNGFKKKFGDGSAYASSPVVPRENREKVETWAPDQRCPANDLTRATTCRH
jgi:hypothetical protein